MRGGGGEGRVAGGALKTSNLRLVVTVPVRAL